MLATQVISEVQRLGASITVEDTGENLVIEPGSLLTPEMIDELRRCKEDILKILRRDEVQQDTSLGLGAQLRAISRDRAQRKDSSPPPPAPGGGRDPLVHRGSDKGQFFRGDWRTTWPHDFEVYKGGES